MLKPLMTLGLLTALLAGCVRSPESSYCDIASPHYFAGEATLRWLLTNDRQLLVDTIIHNETHERLCGGQKNAD
jgi:hypothetical protein